MQWYTHPVQFVGDVAQHDNHRADIGTVDDTLAADAVVLVIASIVRR